MSTHTTKRLGEGRYEYRGYILESDGCLASGNDGAWLCMELRLSSTTLRDLKREVDRVKKRGTGNRKPPSQRKHGHVVPDSSLLAGWDNLVRKERAE